MDRTLRADHGEMLTQLEDLFGKVLDHELIKCILQNCMWDQELAAARIIDMVDPDRIGVLQVHSPVTGGGMVRNATSLPKVNNADSASSTCSSQLSNHGANANYKVNCPQRAGSQTAGKLSNISQFELASLSNCSTPNGAGISNKFSSLHLKLQSGTKMMLIMRGLPGSGKSTLAADLKSQRGVILSADDFFCLKTGVYDYEPHRIGDAHAWVQRMASQQLRMGTTPVIIDNTNLEVWEMKPYVQMALDCSYDVDIIEADSPWRLNVAELSRRNSHGVPKNKITEMKARYQSGVTVENIMEDLRGFTRNSLKSEKVPNCKPSNIDEGISRNLEEISKSKIQLMEKKDSWGREVPGFNSKHRRPVERDDPILSDSRHQSVCTPPVDQNCEGVIENYSSEDSTDDYDVIIEGESMQSESEQSVMTDMIQLPNNVVTLGLQMEKVTVHSDSMQTFTTSQTLSSSQNINCGQNPHPDSENSSFIILANSTSLIPTLEHQSEPGYTNSILAELSSDFAGKQQTRESVTDCVQRDHSNDMSYVVSTSSFDCGNGNTGPAYCFTKSMEELSTSFAGTELIDPNDDSTLDEEEISQDKFNEMRESLNTAIKHALDKTLAPNAISNFEGAAFIECLDEDSAMYDLLESKKAVQEDVIQTDIFDTNGGFPHNVETTCSKNQSCYCEIEVNPNVSVGSQIQCEGMANCINFDEGFSNGASAISNKACEVEKLAEFLSCGDESLASWVHVEPLKEESISTFSSEEQMATEFKTRESPGSSRHNNVSESVTSLPYCTGAIPKRKISSNESSKMVRSSSPVPKPSSSRYSTATIESQTTADDFQALVHSPEHKVKIMYGNENYQPCIVVQTDAGPLTKGKFGLDKGVMTEEPLTPICNKKSASVQHLIGFFPDLKEAEVLDVLEKCKYDLNWAMNILLDGGYDLSERLVDNIQNVNESSEEDIQDFVDKPSSTFCNEGPSVGTEQERKRKRCKQSQKPMDLCQKEAIENAFGLPLSNSERVQRLTGQKYGSLNVSKSHSWRDLSNSPWFSGESGNSPKMEEGSDCPQYVPLVLDSFFASQLVQMFGPITTCALSGDVSDVEYRSVLLSMDMCQQIHQYWNQTQEGKLKNEMAVLDRLIQEDEAMARRLQEEENTCYQSEAPTSEPNDIGILEHDQPTNFREIMDLEQAVQNSQGDLLAQPLDMSQRLNLKRLFAEYAHIDRVAVEDEFVHSGYVYADTVSRLQRRYGSEKGVPTTVVAPEALYRYEQEMVRRAQVQSLKEQHELEMCQSQEGEHDLSPPDDPQVYRDEAKAHYQQRQAALSKARDASRQGMKAVAAYYAQLANLQYTKLKEANQRASGKILSAVNANRNENELDLHMLHVPEALQSTKNFLAEQQAMLEARADMMEIKVNLITGRGAHSMGGRSILKPAVQDFLKMKGLQFCEANSGLLVVTLKRSGVADNP